MARTFSALSTWLLAVTACSSSLAMEVTISASGSPYLQGEPIYVWVDYYNDSGDEVGVADRYLFASDTVTIRDHNDAELNCAFESVPRRPFGQNKVTRIPAMGHLVILTNLLDSFNLRDAGSYSLQISTSNYKPERDLDKQHPVVPSAKMLQGPIESTRWTFTIAAGSGKAFKLAAMDKKWGLFGLQHHADEIVADYPDSPYTPYARMSQIEQLLYSEGSGPKPLAERLESAQTLFARFRSDYSGSSLLEVASVRYADRLSTIGQYDAAFMVLRTLQAEQLSEFARRYVDQQMSRLALAVHRQFRPN